MDQAKIEGGTIKQEQFDSLLNAERQLKRRDFIYVRFTNSRIEGGEFSNLVFYGCDFRQIKLQALSLRSCRFWNCRFEQVQLTELQIENCEFLNCQIYASLIQSSRVCDCSFFQVKSDAVVERNTLLGLNLLECDLAELKLAENQSTMLMIDQATRLTPNRDSVRHLLPIEGYEQSFKITIIGAPLVGKTSIMFNLRKQLRAHGPIRQQVGQMNHSLLHLYGQIAARPIHICTSPGSVLYQHLTLLPMLAQTDLIIYVYSMDHKLQKDQHAYLNTVCLPYLHQLKKTWKSIPWVLVLNKMDRYQKAEEAQTATKGLSLAELIKKGMPVIPSVAYQGQGSKELLEALAKQIGA
jgi:signal recognition particle receptor subunit beta